VRRVEITRRMSHGPALRGAGAMAVVAAACLLAGCSEPDTTPAPSTSAPSPTISTTSVAASTTTVVLEGVHIAPGTDIQNLVDTHPPGTAFVLETGTHSNQKVVPKDGNTFLGEPGAVMDGGNETDAAFSGGGSKVTIQGLIIQNYNTPAQRGAIEGAAREWRIIGNEIRNNAGGGINVGYEADSLVLIRGNYIHHNEQIGLVIQDAVSAQVVGNEIAHNNPNDRYEYDWESGGTKFLRTTDLLVADNDVHDNHGPGLWTDYDNYGTTYENNTVRDNYGPGIFHEVSYDAVIRDNTVTGNAQQFYVGGILISSSSNVEVTGNTLDGNQGGIIGLQDDRGSGSRGTFQTTELHVHDNNVAWNNGFHGIQVNSGPDIIQSGTLSYDHNTYETNQDEPFKWGTNSQTWQEWQTLGQDANSKLN
jgi:parallel beta-helix repeat protein